MIMGTALDFELAQYGINVRTDGDDLYDIYVSKDGSPYRASLGYYGASFAYGRAIEVFAAVKYEDWAEVDRLLANTE